MACFLVPAAEAIVTTITKRVVEKKEDMAPEELCVEAASGNKLHAEHEIPFLGKMRWLNTMLWGGTALLALEHLWHGEILFRFPFLTAAYHPAEMLHEMMTVGVTMAAMVTLVWLCMVAISSAMEKKHRNVFQNNRKIKILGMIYGGACLMCFADAIFAVAESGRMYFFPGREIAVDNLFLALAAAALGLAIWMLILCAPKAKRGIRLARWHESS